MNIHSKDDQNEVVKYGKEIIEEKLRGIYNDNKIKGCEMVSSDRANWGSILQNYIKKVQNIKPFEFFPYEKIPTKVFARFCVEYLFETGALSDPLGLVNIPYIPGQRQLMDGLIKEKYHILRRSGAVNSFILDKNKLKSEFENEENIPDCSEPSFVYKTAKFKDASFKVDFNDGYFISPQKVINDTMYHFNEYYKNFFDSLSIHLEMHYDKKAELQTDNLYDYIQALQIQKCTIDAVNWIIQESMQLFILDNFGKESIGELAELSRFAELLTQKMSNCVWEFRNNIKCNFDEEAMTAFSINFAFYLNQWGIDGLKSDIVDFLCNENKEDYMQYNEYYEKFAQDPQKTSYFITESENKKNIEIKEEKAKETAKKYYYKKGFDSVGDDLIYCTKIFYYEMYMTKDKYPGMAFSKIMDKNDNELTIDETIFRNAKLDRAHFRQKRQLACYRQFYDIYFKFCSITRMSYLTMSPEKGMVFLKNFLEKFLIFFVRYNHFEWIFNNKK